jgi:Na+-translocating ferredoxin:NAD+ oxidoreductase subunit E
MLKEYWGIYKKGIIMENPILVLAMSLCPALAVTGTVKNALTMGLAVLFVITMNNIGTSITRKFVNPKVRVPVYITIIATIVTVVQLCLQAFAPDLYKALGIYLALVVVFAIILARAEVFASKNKVLPSMVDGLGMGSGFLVAMVLIGAIREVLGAGTFLGFQLLGSWYDPAMIVALPPGGFILLGYLAAGTKLLTKRMEEKAKAKEKAQAALQQTA